MKTCRERLVYQLQEERSHAENAFSLNSPPPEASVMKTRVSRTESAVGFVILLALVGVCVWIYERQSRFDPSVLVMIGARQEVTGPRSPVSLAESPFRDFIPDGLAAMGPPERFGAETLSEKIDGKAELYLSSGFVSLASQRFFKDTDNRLWLEVFVYDMGDAQNAFSVFSSQRREDGEEVGLTRFAYRAGNALFMAHGREYVEIVGSDEALADEILRIGERLVDARPPVEEELGEVSVFPAEGLDPASITLLSANVFGYEVLDNTYTAAYEQGKWKLMAFVSLRPSPDEARSLASDYVRFLMDNGGTLVESSLSIPGVKVVQLFDTYEVVFSKGLRLAGVHEADDLAAAEALALKLHDALP